ncbi:MAG: lipoyl(octanoyl) transferase LipB [Maricaulis sp.]|uniref:lipoyl(octanoyl) transferase LipB n=1 Tax=Maricaulis sp. TaxID=1486257 RepID=UPI001B1D3331|nr:lipoyl(octanoyl) transferase LipB [Maricaulis sp.]MBO6728239.1 lipoyl(octanoyl) transferase LipB [Maricaulis sp.]MBO6847245.1 lipoyl(octanoyl) transferase LipB [Maricaulis sp.]MBO6876556.1 lipoyl(octanoyl) transferase LipB [Maricaulis sp.]
MTLPSVNWAISTEKIPYEAAVAFMEDRAAAIARGEADELVWLLEHDPLYTAGTSSKPEDLLTPDRFPVFETGRGGEYTYHGPGQRVAYVMLDLTRRDKDVRKFIQNLERWLIGTAAAFGVEAGPREGRVGVWVDRGRGREDKIAAIGVRLRRWVSFHGIAFNVAPDLTHFGGITPCGISNPLYGVTSLDDLGLNTTMEDFDTALHLSFVEIFGDAKRVEAPDLSAYQTAA